MAAQAALDKRSGLFKVLTVTPSHARLVALYEGTPIKTLLRFSGLMFLTLSMGFGQSAKPLGTQLIYAAPAGGFLNTFPVLTIDPSTGGFSSVFNVLGPPFILCSGGTAAAGSQFFYVSLPVGCSNQASQIVGYSIDQTTGQLTPLSGSPFTLSSFAIPNGMAAGPSGKVLYVADATGYVHAFRIDAATGNLQPLKGSPYKAGTTYALVVDPSGKFLYASVYDHPGGVFAFRIAADGTLAVVPGSPFKVFGPNDANYGPVGIVDTGKYVYVALSNNNEIAAFSINGTTGALQAVPGSPFATGNAPVFLAKAGRYLYTENQLDGTISGYSIDDSSGTLTPVQGSPFAAAGVNLTVEKTGRYLYLSTERSVQSFNIDQQTGALTTGVGTHGNDGTLWLTVVELPDQSEK